MMKEKLHILMSLIWFKRGFIHQPDIFLMSLLNSINLNEEMKSLSAQVPTSQERMLPTLCEATTKQHEEENEL